MANIIVRDLLVAEDLDSNQMAEVNGGVYAPYFPTKGPMNEYLSYGTNGITILGEEKYGGWGGQW